MANCNKLFLEFDNNLNISKTKKDKLKSSKDNIRDEIKDYFKKNHPEYIPQFYIQGSYKMKTMILTKDNECDLDDGVHFKREVGVTGTTLQKWVKEAVKDITSTPAEHKKKCIRVIYKSDYHIDLPVYYFPEDKEHPLLAVKNEELEESDPKELVDWYIEEKSEDLQLNRIVKYLKAWGDYKRNKMPSGLVMTILASNNIDNNERDDIALKNTLINIQNKIDEDYNGIFECFVPVTPKDDLFTDYDDTRKNNFLTNLTSFIKDAEKAIDEEKNQLAASKLWRKYFGEKFPLGEDENTDEKENALNELKGIILSGNAYSQKNGSISDKNNEVKHKPHKNYGGQQIL